MPLETFSFPLPETRFFRADGFIYKLKIRGGSSFSGEEVMQGNYFNKELEYIIRTVLGNLDNLQPFSSTHFNVFPYKERWEGLSKVMCKHGEKNLRAYPFILILYLEKNTQNGTHAEKGLRPPHPKRRKTDSPLEEAILQDLVKELEAESQISMVGRLHVDNPHEEGEVKEDPGHVVKLKSDINMMSESPGEVQPGAIQNKEVEEEDRAASERPGFLTRLARRNELISTKREKEDVRVEDGLGKSSLHVHRNYNIPVKYLFRQAGTPDVRRGNKDCQKRIFPFSLFFRDD